MQLTRGGLEACGSIIVGNKVIVNQSAVVRPSQLIASVRQTIGDGEERDVHTERMPADGTNG
jgi:hypothetical protein